MYKLTKTLKEYRNACKRADYKAKKMSFAEKIAIYKKLNFKVK